MATSALSRFFKKLFEVSPTLQRAAANANAELVEEMLDRKKREMETEATTLGKLLHLKPKKPKG